MPRAHWIAVILIVGFAPCVAEAAEVYSRPVYSAVTREEDRAAVHPYPAVGEFMKITSAYGADALAASTAPRTTGEFVAVKSIYDAEVAGQPSRPGPVARAASLSAKEPYEAGIADTCQQCCPLIRRECGEKSWWTLRFGALYLSRNRPSSNVLVTSTFDPASTPLVNANQFNLNMNWGWDVSAIFHGAVDSPCDFEMRYFGVYSQVSKVDAGLSPTGSAVQFVDPIGNVLFPSAVSASYVSQVQSAELNVRRFVYPRLQLLAGFRWLELAERDLAIYQDIGPGLNLASNRVGSMNRLWGGQIGADASVWQYRRVSIEAMGKGGVYVNDMNNGVVVTQSAFPNLIFSSAGQSYNTAFVGELGVTGLYRLNEDVAIRCGYQLLCLDGVALASDQVRVSNPTQDSTSRSPIAVNTALYQGAFFGFEFYQ